MNILVVEPNKTPYPQEISGSLESMQEIVGGLIAAIYPFSEAVVLVCHDEGKLLRFPLNRVIRTPDGSVLDIIALPSPICEESRTTTRLQRRG